VAFDGERWVGQSDLIPYPHKRDVAVTGLTGVVGTHRRRGIATALKVTALERARQAEVRFVHTDNVADSPMLQLNLRLGFREGHAFLTFRKSL
jgi:GNAT superfamily N-acetyltransferase